MFSNIIGHKNVTSFLEKSLKNGQIAQAYLFYGPAHLGKRTVAEKFTEMLLGQPIALHPDVYLVGRERDAKEDKLAKNISIEQMRELERKLSLSSFLNSYKIGIIEEAETLSIEAANSLLKTLEEPPPKTVIILLASNIAALPQTIVSRCQVLKFLPVSQSEIYEHLLVLGAKRDLALHLTNISWGKPGKAVSFWQSQAEHKESILALYQERAKDLVGLMGAETFNEKMKIVGKFFSDNKNTQELVGNLNADLLLWSSILRDIALIKNDCQELIFNSLLADELKNLADRLQDDLLPKLYREIRLAGKYLGENFNPRLVMENLVLTF